MVLTSPLAAQQGTLTGRVTDEQGQPVDAAQISVLGTGTGGLTDAAGRYSLSLPAGSYSLVVNVVGFREQRFDGIRVASGQATSFNIQLTSMAYELDPVVITASRAAEKETDAPATTFTVGEIELDERPVTTPAEHLRLAPGVDIITHGLQASNVVVRGFNNIFSGALHMLHDYRLAGVPSLRVNLLHFIPSNQADLARMEVVLGPASALYGPNTANGVVHIITKSPLDDQGTTVTVGGGQRNVFQGSFRSAFLLSDDFGLKVSGQYPSGASPTSSFGGSPTSPLRRPRATVSGSVITTWSDTESRPGPTGGSPTTGRSWPRTGGTTRRAWSSRAWDPVRPSTGSMSSTRPDSTSIASSPRPI
jgi:iron complex outermembrane receptor protein